MSNYMAVIVPIVVIFSLGAFFGSVVGAITGSSETLMNCNKKLCSYLYVDKEEYINCKNDWKNFEERIEILGELRR